MIATRNRVLYLGSDDGPADEASVRFRLTYDGPLQAYQRGKTDKASYLESKKRIRRSLHEQLKKLWEVDRFYQHQLRGKTFDRSLNAAPGLSTSRLFA